MCLLDHWRRIAPDEELCFIHEQGAATRLSFTKGLYTGYQAMLLRDASRTPFMIHKISSLPLFEYSAEIPLASLPHDVPQRHR